jgi:hypothetical protein
LRIPASEQPKAVADLVEFMKALTGEAPKGGSAP